MLQITHESHASHANVQHVRLQTVVICLQNVHKKDRKTQRELFSNGAEQIS